MALPPPPPFVSPAVLPLVLLLAVAPRRHCSPVSQRAKALKALWSEGLLTDLTRGPTSQGTEDYEEGYNNVWHHKLYPTVSCRPSWVAPAATFYGRLVNLSVTFLPQSSACDTAVHTRGQGCGCFAPVVKPSNPGFHTPSTQDRKNRSPHSCRTPGEVLTLWRAGRQLKPGQKSRTPSSDGPGEDPGPSGSQLTGTVDTIGLSVSYCSLMQAIHSPTAWNRQLEKFAWPGTSKQRSHRCCFICLADGPRHRPLGM